MLIFMFKISSTIANATQKSVPPLVDCGTDELLRNFVPFSLKATSEREFSLEVRMLEQ